ncbi:hypothetical protein ACFYN3_28295 [Streptomyces lavendulae]|uniref:hypothetical protein n=1 Tax=Streptomyces lavendulae TaxID=1914 RepID=UPI0036C4A0CF
MPQEFAAFDLSQSPEERADATIARLNSTDPALSSDKIARVAVLTQQTAAGLLAAGGVVYAGTLVATSHENPTHRCPPSCRSPSARETWPTRPRSSA